MFDTHSQLALPGGSFGLQSVATPRRRLNLGRLAELAEPQAVARNPREGGGVGVGWGGGWGGGWVGGGWWWLGGWVRVFFGFSGVTCYQVPLSGWFGYEWLAILFFFWRILGKNTHMSGVKVSGWVTTTYRLSSNRTF